MEIREPIPWFPHNRANTIVASCIEWYPDTPLQVTLRFGANGSPTTDWVFSRNLFREAQEHGNAGRGDVRLTFREGFCHLGLTSPNGSVMLRTYDALIQRFLAKTYAVVPLDDEAGHTSFSDADLEEIMTQWGTLM